MLGRPDAYAAIKQQIRDLFFTTHKARCGYRRITVEMRKKEETSRLNHKTVQRLMQEMGLKSKTRRKRYNAYRGTESYTAPNILQRDFNAEQPNQKWVTDVTELNVAGQRVYLSPLIDLYNQEVIAYRIKKSAHLPLVTEMLDDALDKLSEDEKPVLHSDQGWQYRQKSIRERLEKKGLTQSMSRKGNCLDNAVAENFFALLKTEMYHNQSFEDADALIEQIKEYIEYYNTKRIKVKLKGLTPIEYRTQALKAA